MIHSHTLGGRPILRDLQTEFRNDTGLLTGMVGAEDLIDFEDV